MVGDGVVHDFEMRVVHQRLEVRSGEAISRIRKLCEVHRRRERDFATERCKDLQRWSRVDISIPSCRGNSHSTVKRKE